MPRYRVTVRTSSTEIVDADNEYMAAIAVAAGRPDEVEIADVRPAVGRAPSTNGARKAAKKAVSKKTTVAKKRRRLSPEARAKLAQNLVKARAARAAKRKSATKKKSKKASTKKRAARTRA